METLPSTNSSFCLNSSKSNLTITSTSSVIPSDCVSFKQSISDFDITSTTPTKKNIITRAYKAAFDLWKQKNIHPYFQKNCKNASELYILKNAKASKLWLSSSFIRWTNWTKHKHLNLFFNDSEYILWKAEQPLQEKTSFESNHLVKLKELNKIPYFKERLDALLEEWKSRNIHPEDQQDLKKRTKIRIRYPSCSETSMNLYLLTGRVGYLKLSSHSDDGIKYSDIFFCY